MNCQSFYDTLSSYTDINDRIEFLKTVNYDFFNESQPDAIVTRFYDLSTQKQAFLLADAFRMRMGNLVICREASFEERKMMTIMDCLKLMVSDLDVGPFQMIFNAFRILGFAQASECDAQDLIVLYSTGHPAYFDAINHISISYDYADIQKKNSWIDKELQQYLFEPNRIYNWIIQDREVEEYMM